MAVQLAPGMAFLFDMDGVIIDSMAMHTLAWEQYLRTCGVTREGIPERMLGKRNDQILRDFFGETLTDEEILEHGFAKERLYRELMTPVFEHHVVRGVREFLGNCNGILCGMGTNAEPLNVDYVLKGTGLLERFSAIVDGHQVQNAKPAPDIYLQAAARLGVAPQNCVVFEDSRGGLAAGRAAGARVVCVETTLENEPGTDFRIRDFTDPSLLAWLATLTPRIPVRQ